ncbi:MAG: hypothetical protein PHR77_14910 [Kiritimatiellae bacterium]|nr:hypothetical protein [Kiritimatiellia bacterium]
MTLGVVVNKTQADTTSTGVLSDKNPAGGHMHPVAIRPYQLLCLVCSLGEDGAVPKNRKLKDLMFQIRKNPDMPITLQCEAGIGFAFQAPEAARDNDFSPEFNQKRDLTILQRLDMPPGETLPARILIHRLLKSIPLTAGICGFGEVTADAWKGCPKAESGFYEKGHKKAIEALILIRTEEEMAGEKKASIQAMREADAVRIRPHIMVCSVCQYGSGIRPPYKPDNLPELIAMVLTEKPDMRVTLVRGADWMICAPCPYRNAQLGWCVTGQINAGGLYCEMKDLNVLQRLGLTYGATLKARDLYKLIFEKMPTVVNVCALDANGKSPYSVWRDACGGAPEAERNYLKGRAELMAKLK